MGVHDILFPENLSPGSRGGPGHATQVRQGDSGIETRLSAWNFNNSGLTFDVAKDVQSEEDTAELLDLYMAMYGGGCGFRFKDPTDWTTNPSGTRLPDINNPAHRSQLAPVDPTAGIWQLQKTYTGPNGRKAFRRITRPIKVGETNHLMAIYANGVLVYINGVAAAGIEVTVSYDTGLVYLPGFPATINMEAAFTFHVASHFGQDTDDQLNIRWDESGQFSVPVQIDELVGDTGVAHEEHLYGGGQDVVALPPLQTLHLRNGTYQRIIGTLGQPLTVRMPDETSLPEPLAAGGPYFLIENGTNLNIFVTSWSGSLIGVITPGGYGEMHRIQFGTVKDWEMR